MLVKCEVAKAAGKTWAGPRPGKRTKVTPEQERAIRQLKAEGTPVVKIAKAVGLTRPTVYSVLSAG